jgi:hypothetical protein
VPVNVVHNSKDEAHWERAKKLARKQYPSFDGSRYYRVVMSIYEKMKGSKSMGSLFLAVDNDVIDKNIKGAKTVRPLSDAKKQQRQASFKQWGSAIRLKKPKLPKPPPQPGTAMKSLLKSRMEDLHAAQKEMYSHRENRHGGLTSKIGCKECAQHEKRVASYQSMVDKIKVPLGSRPMSARKSFVDDETVEKAGMIARLVQRNLIKPLKAEAMLNRLGVKQCSGCGGYGDDSGGRSSKATPGAKACGTCGGSGWEHNRKADSLLHQLTRKSDPNEVMDILKRGEDLTVCRMCNGEGKFFVFWKDAFDQIHKGYRPCPVCGGIEKSVSSKVGGMLQSAASKLGSKGRRLLMGGTKAPEPSITHSPNANAPLKVHIYSGIKNGRHTSRMASPTKPEHYHTIAAMEQKGHHVIHVEGPENKIKDFMRERAIHHNTSVKRSCPGCEYHKYKAEMADNT